MKPVVITLLFLLAGVCNPPASADPIRPNIVVILCDDLGYGDLACFANPAIKTPHLDQLAADGMKFTSCYSASPVCSPSRAGMMTGRNPNRLGIRDWIPDGTGIYMRPGEITSAQLLKQAGYKTCHVGKWHLNSKVDGSERTPGDSGFDHWFYTQNNAIPSHQSPNNFVRYGQPVGKTEGSSSHLCVAEATHWLDSVKGAPFFLNVWFHEPHERVDAAQEFLDLYPDEPNLDKRHYFGDVSQMDAAVGKLLKYLDEHELRQNTLVFFSSDNGPETFKRYANATRSYGTPGPLKGMKLHVTEAGYRVPGIVRWPGHVQAGSLSNTPICSVDLLPTFCELAGVEPPKDRRLDGASLVSFLTTGGPIERPHPLYWHYDFAISEPWEVAMRDGDWKLLADRKLENFQLINIVKDLGETEDISAQHPDRVQKMAAEMRRLNEEINAESGRSGNPPPTRTSKEPAAKTAPAKQKAKQK